MRRTTHTPPLDGVWREVAGVPAATNAPDHAGGCGAVVRPALRRRTGLGRTRCTRGLRAGDALPRPGGAAGVHQPRPARCADPAM